MELIIKRKDEKTESFSIMLNYIFIFFELLFCFSLTRFNQVNPLLIYGTVILVVLAVSIIYLFFINKNFVINAIKLCSNPLVCLLALLSSISIVLDHILFNNKTYYKAFLIMFLLSLPFIFVLMLKIYEFICNRVKNFINSLSNFDKKFLIISSAIMIVFMVGSNLISGMFSGSPTPNSSYYQVYNFDPNHHHIQNTFADLFSIQNNFRHYFVTLSVYPFMSVTSLFSHIIRFDYLHKICFYLLQMFMLQVIVILLFRLLKIENKLAKITFCLLFMLSSTFIVNFLVYEKFIIPVFYLILTFYAMENNDNVKYFYYFFAVGTLTTFIILCPLIFFNGLDKLKESLLNIIIFGLIFLFVLCLIGSTFRIFNVFVELEEITKYTGEKATFGRKLIYFFCMLGNLFIVPKNLNIQHNIIEKIPTTSSVEFYLGIIVFIFCIISIILNRKESYIKYLITGLLYTIFMGLIIGYGVGENEMFLSSFTYFWSIIPLFFMGVNKLLKNKKIFAIIVLCLTAFELVYNIFILCDVYSYAHSVFPFSMVLENYFG